MINNSSYLEKIYQDVDTGIRPIVELLNEAGYETFMSCQGGEGHSSLRPVVGIFVHGDYFEFREKFVEFLNSHVSRFILTLRSEHGASVNEILSNEQPRWTEATGTPYTCTPICYLELYSLDDITP